MGSIGGWFRSLIWKMSQGLRRFMAGRYGTDQLNMVILIAGLVCSVLSSVLRIPLVTLILWALSWGLMIWAIFRSLSKNIYARYQENRKYLQLKESLKDRDHRYFDCPKCRQRVRVPRGKGRISITCPKCAEKFVRKT